MKNKVTDFRNFICWGNLGVDDKQAMTNMQVCKMLIPETAQ